MGKYSSYWYKLKRLQWKQTSQDVDLPPRKQIMSKGKRFYVSEIPFDPQLMDSIFPAHPSYEPGNFPVDEEGVYVKGRNWTIG